MLEMTFSDTGLHVVLGLPDAGGTVHRLQVPVGALLQVLLYSEDTHPIFTSLFAERI